MLVKLVELHKPMGERVHLDEIYVSSSAVTASTNTVTINPTANLVTLEGYYILIDATAIDDASGNSYAGIGNSSVLNFTAADLSPPTLTSTSPADNATGVALDSNGNVYVGDTSNQLVRKIDSSGNVTTLAGEAGISGSTNGQGTTAKFNKPNDVAVDSLGNVYVADKC